MYQFTYQPTPKNILLDLMGVRQNYALETSQLSIISAAFNISINNLRVSLNRLQSDNLISNDERGVYTLTNKALAKRKFINRWRLEPTQNSPWDTSWLACHLPIGSDRSLRKKSLHALEWHGFKPSLDQVWVRPNNLNPSSAELSVSLSKLGLEPAANCFVMHEVQDALASQWAQTLWDVVQLDQDYAELTQKLQDSLASLQSKSIEVSLAETCHLGGEAIHRLAMDPLLPKEIRPGKHYQQLKNAMITYNHAGREIWLEQLEQLGVNA